MRDKLSFSLVIPAYRASETVGATLQSVFSPTVSIPSHWQIEAIVVDDGSPDAEALYEVLKAFPQVRLLRHESNKGMCASRNTGITVSTGDVVTILDADDALVPEWPEIFSRVLKEWPEEANVCFSVCRNPDGRPTVSEPDYTGFLTQDDLLNERNSGEYLPLFRGPYIRNRRYVNLRMRKSCGIVSYLTMAKDGPFWVSSHVLRIYNDRQAGSVSRFWTRPDKARETARCYSALLEKFGDLYAIKAPHLYRTKLLRYAVYLHLAGEEGAWRIWKQAAHWKCLPETVGVFFILLFGCHFCTWAVGYAKKIGVIRRYG
jgi:glycosyltransferase involved in cell wall biosynthesis